MDSNIQLEPERSLIVPQQTYLTHQYAYQFNRVAAQRPEVKRPVYHVSLSLPPGENLSDEQWKQVAQRYLSERGFENCQYVLVRHNDRTHEHCHIVTSRVSLDGQVVDIAWDYYRSQEVIRPLEQAYNLTQVQNSWEIDRSQQT
ncbi:MAG: relaxase/mobilization nuclease domain-containing protein, partial [Prochloraceae cyanobacterium]